MSLACLFVEDSPVTTDVHGLATVSLHRSHELDCAVAVPVVVPVDKGRHPLACLVLAGKRPVGVVRLVFGRAEQGFRVEVVVGHPRSGEGSEYSQLLQPAFERCSTHGVAVVGVQDQWLAAAFADPLPQAGSAHQIRCNGWILALGDIPGHNLAAPDVDHQVEVSRVNQVDVWRQSG